MATPTTSPAHQETATIALTPPRRSLGDELVRAACVFQAGPAIPIVLVLGSAVFVSLLVSSVSLYEFVAYIANALMAAGIIFITIIQWRISSDDKLSRFGFEIAKSLLATAMWTWLLLDTIFAHNDFYKGYPEWRLPRVKRAAISVVLLWVLFYPTLAYTGWQWFKSRASTRDKGKDVETQRNVQEDAREDIVETTPLLRDGS